MYNNFQKFSVKHPEWIKKSTIYEVHIRQYTQSGTLKEFALHLPRLKTLGVEILWLMPIQPIGMEKKKGRMGSPYSIRDFYSVNPDIGTLDDLKDLVNKAHKSGMFVILDWVANHTAWDNIWIYEHPDFYCKDSNGNIIHPEHTDWFDVADLNYDNPALRTNMIEALKYWIKEVDIDGYRCDMAHLVPTDFWETVRIELDKLKPVFLLAESENQELLYNAFDANYNWPLLHMINDLAKGHRSIKNLDDFFIYDNQNYPLNAFRLNFTTNHDENKNAGSAIERLGNALEVLTVLTFTIPGIPLIFSGQEAGLNRKLEFFDKDLIDWHSGRDYSAFFKTLIQLKKDSKPLWNTNDCGPLIKVGSNMDDKIFAFMRQKDDDKVLVVLNLTPYSQEFILYTDNEFQTYHDIFTGSTLMSNHPGLGAWGYLVMVK